MSRMRDYDLESSLDQKENTDFFPQFNWINNENEIIKIIDEFFGITSAFEREIKMANRIKKAYKRMRQRKWVRKFQKWVYRSSYIKWEKISNKMRKNLR